MLHAKCSSNVSGSILLSFLVCYKQWHLWNLIGHPYFSLR
uniref:Uncharacterized protein n=1 Tax=Anguilla anguilla TaxID=7936 RepID=A0A0E9XS20_ANGAN